MHVCPEAYPAPMRYRAEAYLLNTDRQVADLASWATQQAARQACTDHAGQLLIWIARGTRVWEAQGSKHWYRIVISQA